MGRQGSGEAALVVVPEVLGVLVRFREGNALLVKNLLKASEVQRFGVGDHAVEIEDDGTQDRHVPVRKSERRRAMKSNTVMFGLYDCETNLEVGGIIA